MLVVALTPSITKSVLSVDVLCENCSPKETTYAWTESGTFVSSEKNIPIDYTSQKTYKFETTVTSSADASVKTENIVISPRYIVSNDDSYAALKSDGSVVTWGNKFFGGDSSRVDLTGGVVTIFSNGNSYAAVKSDGSVVTWGRDIFGGDCSGVDLTGGIETLFSNEGSYAALKSDGSIVTWGNVIFGGNSRKVDLSEESLFHIVSKSID